MGGIRRVFTFYKLLRVSPQPNNFQIENRFEVWSQPTNSTMSCQLQSNIPRCCDRFEVPLFSLESTLTFGVLTQGTTSTGTDYNLLRFRSAEMYEAYIVARWISIQCCCRTIKHYQCNTRTNVVISHSIFTFCH